MHALSDKAQIETKLEKENSRLMLLRNRVDKYHDLTRSMSKILTTFEQRLGKLEQTILPVYNETENLQNRQQNLTRTLDCLQTVLSHYDSSQELCSLIHSGPADGNVADFLAALNKLKVAKDYFLNNNPQSVELENVTSLFNNGCETLNNYYRSLLRKHCTPLKPVQLLDLICVIEDDPAYPSAGGDGSSSSSMQYPPAETRDELNTISNWLDNNLRREYMQIYADERSEVMFRSLKLLKEHQRSSSWENEPLKPRNYGRTDQRKTTSSRLQAIFEKKTNKMLARASQTFEYSTGISIAKRSSDNTLGDDSSADGGANGTNGDQELEQYLMLLLGLQRLLIRERQLLVDVVPKARHNDIFSRLSQSSVDMVVKDAETISSKVLKNIARKEWSAALGVFSALKNITLLQPDIGQACDKVQRQQLNSVMKTFEQTGQKTLDTFLELVKYDTGGHLVGMANSSLSGNSVPSDATVHELTSNTIWFMEHLFDHAEVIGVVLQENTLYTSQLDVHTHLMPDDRNRALLGLYIKKVLSELNLTIVTKCEQYSDLATRHLFRLNNIHYILKSLQRTKLLDVLQLTERDCEKYYEELIRELKNAYQKSWARLLANVAPLDDLPRPTNGRVKDKERPVLKERFTNFNKELEETHKTQRSISIPDVILRNSLKRDNVENIIPQYNAFFETYSEVSFSRHPEKYLKYRPQDVSAMLNTFFDDRV